MKRIFIVDVPDDSKIIGCDFWIEQFSESYKKQSHITDYTEFTPPDDAEISDEAESEWHKNTERNNPKTEDVAYQAGVRDGFITGANWMKGKLI